MNSITVEGWRRSQATGQVTVVPVSLELDKEKMTLSIVSGGVTGYEGFYVDTASRDSLRKMGLGHLSLAQGCPSNVEQEGWLACAGRDHEYDTLYLPPGSMREVAEHFSLWK